jgi:hypothetical protein
MPPRGSATRVWPELRLAVDDWPDLAGHLEREYGPAVSAANGGTDAPIALRIGRLRSSSPSETGGAASAVSGARHKTTTWSLRLSPPEADPIRAELRIRGVFGRSLAQSNIIEPLIAASMSRREAALVPAAGIVVDDRVVLLSGASRSGKSTLAMRAWARGNAILGDDRVILTPDATVAPFPRRLRLYPDLRSTATGAYARVGARVRSSLRRAETIRRLTLGWIGLPVLVPAQRVLQDTPAPLGRLVIIERRDDEEHLRWIDGLEPALDRLETVVRRDMRSLADHDAAWGRETGRVVARIRQIASAALGLTGAGTGVLVVPRHWPAPAALAAVERELGLTE